MKNQILSIRINETIKERLEMLGLEKGETSSELIRSTIDKLLKKTEVLCMGNNRFYCEEKDQDILHSLEFTELLFWISDKHLDSEIMEAEDFYRSLISTINNINKSKFFESGFKSQLYIIKEELEEYLSNPVNIYFNFPNNSNFDYKFFKDFVHTLRYNENDELVIQYKYDCDEIR